MATARRQSKYRRITFQITTLKPLSIGEQVFIAGNLGSLGSWLADGMPLTRIEDNVWLGSLDVPSTEVVEFKVTLGSWEMEEAEAGGGIPRNHVIRKGTQDVTVKHTVPCWKDGPGNQERPATLPEAIALAG